MDMLKTFFEIGCNKELFDGLKISKETELCKEYMGQFPVIFVTLKSVDGLSYQEAVNALRYVIGIEADTSRADMSRIEKFCGAFPEEDVTLIEEMLHDYLWDSISIRDTAVRKDMKENFHPQGVPSVYHGMVLGLLQSRGDWLLKSNTEIGEGYSDIIICTQDKTGIIIEFKYAEDGNLDKGCAEALKQIEDRKYGADLERGRLKKVLKYGMAFYKKECKVVLASTLNNIETGGEEN